jgi:indolepyruvate ferredoxin oxidoreductase, beta subunit
MSSRVVNVVVAGLGGQGVIKASDILADAAFRAGLDVKKAEIHGMSQRGGSVTSDVRFGALVHSPMITMGEADYLVVLAASEVPVTRPLLAPHGVLIPPDAIPEAKLANKRSLNVALLGVLAARLDIPEEHWQAAIRAALPERLHAVNDAAFQLGKKTPLPRSSGPHPGGTP